MHWHMHYFGSLSAETVLMGTQNWPCCPGIGQVKLPDYTRAKHSNHLWLQSEGNAVSHTSTSLL